MPFTTEKAAYEDFVKREKDNFRRVKGENASFNGVEFLQYQDTVTKEKHAEVVSYPVYLCLAPYNTVISTKTSHRYRSFL